ncbi:Putative short-chain fatty acid transporter [Paraburkholderia ultramafica]|uniref:Short-chain fatty acid transporter n=2 Tax=Paraburkholderia ultramafica TaxID=1544867 RepID=A0A6S7BK23_9BURK|nr:TIGR00366 family protein [Paraburkholderia ultramafica]CAB3802468.1 Putative short-chain fatty acid transporter [Paraburkholderia ultramafica]
MQRAVASCVYLFERLMPDPFVIVILLTVMTALCAMAFAQKGSPDVILSGWYKGIFGIFTFAFQMVLVLVTGYALASAPVIKAGLQSVSRLAVGPCSAVVLVFTVGAIATFLNWGFGLVVGAMLSKQVAKQVRVDFAWLVAAGYSSWVLWAFTGMSSSIALSIASPGNPLNLVEQHTHMVVPLSHTVFSSWNLLTGLAAMLLIPVIFILMRPAESDIIAAKSDALNAADQAAELDDAPRRHSFAGRLESSRLCALVFVMAGAAYLAIEWTRHGISLDINTVIFIFLLAGLCLHGNPARYVGAVTEAAKVTGPMLLQYPFYGGIMGIMAATGLAEVIANAYIHVASATTLPFLSYIASGLITLFIPSGGGHWAVQGPFTIPAAMHLGASLPGTSMAIAAGEMAGSLLQPFWAIPVVAIAGVGVQRVLGFTLVIFLTAGSFLGFVYLFVVPIFSGA